MGGISSQIFAEDDPLFVQAQMEMVEQARIRWWKEAMDDLRYDKASIRRERNRKGR